MLPVSQYSGIINKKNTNKQFQEYLVNTFKNYNPDFFIFGHTNNIEECIKETLEKI